MMPEPRLMDRRSFSKMTVQLDHGIESLGPAARHARVPTAMNQFSLKGMLEFTAGCGFLFAVGPACDLIVYGIAGAVFAIWSLRISRWPLRWLLFNWLSACGSIFLGLACLEQGFLGGEPGNGAVDYWLLCGCGLIVWTPLAGVNGFLFLGELLYWDRTSQKQTRLRRDAAI